MKTIYGDIDEKFITDYVPVNTIAELKKAIEELPDDLPIGFSEQFSVTVFNMPSAPVFEFTKEEFEGTDEHF